TKATSTITISESGSKSKKRFSPSLIPDNGVLKLRSFMFSVPNFQPKVGTTSFIYGQPNSKAIGSGYDDANGIPVSGPESGWPALRTPAVPPDSPWYG